MSTPLILCPSCSSHIHQRAESCAFCGHVLSTAAPGEGVERVAGRAGNLANVLGVSTAAGKRGVMAAMLGASLGLAACGPPVAEPVYGAPANNFPEEDMGADEADMTDDSSDNSTGAPAYGAPALDEQ